MKSKTCKACKRRLPITKFMVFHGHAKAECKECYYKETTKNKFFGFGDRFGHPCLPTAKDAEKCRAAHEELMASLRRRK